MEIKIYGYVNIRKGLMEKTVHKTMYCSKLKKGEWVAITDKSLIKDTKKCKHCFKEEQMRGKVAKTLRRKVYGNKSKRNQGSTMTKTGLRCDQLRGDYQEEKKEYKNK